MKESFVVTEQRHILSDGDGYMKCHRAVCKNLWKKMSA